MADPQQVPHQSPRTVTNVPVAAFLANSRFLTDCYREVAALQSAEGRKCDGRQGLSTIKFGLDGGCFQPRTETTSAGITLPYQKFGPQSRPK